MTGAYGMCGAYIGWRESRGAVWVISQWTRVRYAPVYQLPAAEAVKFPVSLLQAAALGLYYNAEVEISTFKMRKVCIIFVLSQCSQTF